MKANLVFTAALLTSLACAQVSYVTPLRITKLDRATATLSWTNLICANVPVYDVLRSTTVTGNWQHFFFVTNAQSMTLTNSLGASGGAVFHKLAWASDTPMVFNYAFDEGYGAGPCITGRLSVSFASIPAGNWQFQENGLCLDDLHPVGSGSFVRGSVVWTSSPHTVQLYLTPGPEGGTRLEGTLQTTMSNGQCTYTGMSGTVSMGGFAGYSPIGTFTATRVQ